MTGKEAKEKLKKGYDYRNNYTKQNYDRISVTVPKGTKEKIKSYLPENQKVNGLINDLINGWIEEQEQQRQPDLFNLPDLPDLEDMPFK